MSTSEAANAMPHPSREFHLIFDWLFERSADGAEGTGLDRRPHLVLPDGVSFLVAMPGSPAVLLGDSESAEPDRALMLEPIFGQRQPCLVLIPPAGKEVRVNGQVAPSPAVLREKDQVQFDDELLLHVTLFSRPQISAAAGGLVGRECPVCRVPFVAGTRVYACASCGSSMHLQGEDEPEATRLECALAATECPVCQSPIEMTEGYQYEPELYSVA